MWYELATTFNMIIELYILIIVIKYMKKEVQHHYFVSRITDKVTTDTIQVHNFHKSRYIANQI